MSVVISSLTVNLQPGAEAVLEAVAEGRSGQVVDELLETLKYTPTVTGPKR